ncbi:MAG: hypothetical protein ACYSX0_21835, partial [Planctomycetota bacterium]
MLFSLEWLGEHVDLSGLDPERLGELFTMHIANVDEVRDPGKGWSGITVGRVLEVRPHPNADRLRLVTVETSEG